MPRTHGSVLKTLDVDKRVVSRNDTLTSWQTYTLGIGGTCDVFDPPVGYCEFVLFYSFSSKIALPMPRCQVTSHM